MSRVTSERRGAAALITFADPPEGTIDHAGAVELLAAVRAARRTTTSGRW
jgi:hypothetical protein